MGRETGELVIQAMQREERLWVIDGLWREEGNGRGRGYLGRLMFQRG